MVRDWKAQLYKDVSSLPTEPENKGSWNHNFKLFVSGTYKSDSKIYMVVQRDTNSIDALEKGKDMGICPTWCQELV